MLVDLKAIYYGPDIEDEDKGKLHEIAISRGIKNSMLYRL